MVWKCQCGFFRERALLNSILTSDGSGCPEWTQEIGWPRTSNFFIFSLNIFAIFDDFLKLHSTHNYSITLSKPKQVPRSITRSSLFLTEKHVKTSAGHLLGISSSLKGLKSFGKNESARRESKPMTAEVWRCSFG